MRTRIRAGEVPELIRKTAQEFAGEFYEGGRTDRFRTVGISEKAYIRRYWTEFIEPAVQTLSAMLGAPGVEDEAKEKIADAIFAFKNNSTNSVQPLMSLRSLN